jgi:hypothetical protein
MHFTEKFGVSFGGAAWGSHAADAQRFDRIRIEITVSSPEFDADGRSVGR